MLIIVLYFNNKYQHTKKCIIKFRVRAVLFLYDISNKVCNR